jgi:hypothetical protein
VVDEEEGKEEFAEVPEPVWWRCRQARTRAGAHPAATHGSEQQGACFSFCPVSVSASSSAVMFGSMAMLRPSCFLRLVGFRLLRTLHCRASINSQNACFAWDHYNHGSVLIRHRGCDTNAARVLSILKLLQFRKEEEEKKNLFLYAFMDAMIQFLCAV